MQYLKGRGTQLNPHNRYQTRQSEVNDEFLNYPSPDTNVSHELCKSIITRNDSPDQPFSQSINQYRGCEHGCIYCFARPSHAYLDLSPGIDFETQLIVKTNAIEQLDREWRKSNYQCKTIALGTNTDPYQPIERQYKITRQILETALRFKHPISIVTKGQLILRDIDLLAELASLKLCHVGISLTTLDNHLKTILEPRAASSNARLNVIKQLSNANIPTSVLCAPIIPAINDKELETLLSSAQQASAKWATWMLVRLPLEVETLFEDWLKQHFPQRTAHVMSLIKQSRNGKASDARFHHRQVGSGIFAELIQQRFEIACKKLGLNQTASPKLSTYLFSPPPLSGSQMDLW